MKRKQKILQDKLTTVPRLKKGKTGFKERNKKERGNMKKGSE